MTNFEWFQVFLGVCAVALVPLIGGLIKAFSHWADTINGVVSTVDARFETMTKKTDDRWDHMERSVGALRQDFHDHRVCVERRLSRMEVKVDGEVV